MPGSKLLVTSGGKLSVSATGKLIVGGSGDGCCCTGTPPGPENPGDPPDRDPTDPTGSTGCICFTQYSLLIITLSGFVDCSPQRVNYNCSPGGPVIAIRELSTVPSGTWAVPITYSPADSQVGYTNQNVVLQSWAGTLQVKSTDGTVYSSGGFRVVLQSAKVQACNDKTIEATLIVQWTDVIVSNRDAFNNQRADFGVNCADPNGSPDTRTPSGGTFETFSCSATVACALPLTCTDSKLPAGPCDDPLLIDGDLIRGGMAVFTAA